MQDFEFDSTDLAETEEFLACSYTRMRIRSDRRVSRARLSRRSLGSVTFDNIALGFEMSYSADPLQRVCLVRVHSGSITPSGAGLDVLGPGDIAVLTPPEVAYSGRVNARYDITMFDPALFDRVSDRPGNRETAVELTGQRPISGRAGKQLNDVIEYLRVEVASNDIARASDLVSSNAATLLAASALGAFPNTLLAEPNIEKRRDSTPTLLRRATAFIDENAHRDITIDDIAGAVYMSPRSVQYMFRRHLDCTPMEYLRRVRLNHAHHELLASDPTRTTVAVIAAKWGFAHTGRFAGLYRRTHGRSPHVTLRSGV